jgi:type II secretory pathway pseudopilin PulG
MLTAKTRTTILAVVASVSFAAASVAPAVSQARPKTTATKTVTAREACDAVVDSMLNAEQEARNYEKAGDTKSAEASWTAANLYFDVWSEQGCATIAVTIPVKLPPVSAPITPVRGINAKA